MDLKAMSSVFCEDLPTDSVSETDLSKIHEQRRQVRHQAKVREAVEGTHSLSATVQARFLQLYLAEGWGRLAHGVTRQLKSPGRYGLKLVDVALIFTIHDRTVAKVNPVMFAPISMDEFVGETAMDESNIRSALRALVQRGVLLKVQTPRVNFWGLNPHYFTAKGKDNLPPGNLPPGNAPRDKQGNLPGVGEGQITPGQTSQDSGNQKENSDAKNLLKESKKESLISDGNFPEDMAARWTRFQEMGNEGRIKKEREIFEKLFIQHKETFFHFCGRVVEYLEQKGTGKTGAKIHCPMTWIDGYWESNLAQYRQWKTHQENLEHTHASKLAQDAKKKAEETEKARIKAEQEQKDEEWKKKIDDAALRFLDAYSTDAKIMAFAQEAVDLLGCSYTSDWLKKYGWGHPMVRSCVVEHFMLVEAGLRPTSVRTGQEEIV